MRSSAVGPDHDEQTEFEYEVENVSSHELDPGVPASLTQVVAILAIVSAFPLGGAAVAYREVAMFELHWLSWRLCSHAACLGKPGW